MRGPDAKRIWTLDTKRESHSPPAHFRSGWKVFDAWTSDCPKAKKHKKGNMALAPKIDKARSSQQTTLYVNNSMCILTSSF